MIRIGLVGLGGMGTVHYNNYQFISDCKVKAAVCNSDKGKEKAMEFGIRAYDSILSMVEAEKIDVIDICTPTFTHKDYVMEALNLGKHVIVEKPIALHFEDAEEIYELAERNRLLLFVGHVVQFTKETELLREFIKNEKYGKPLDGHFKRLAARPHWIKDGWLFDKEKSGVLPFDLHVHDLDLIISLFGVPEKYNYTSCGRNEVSYREAYRINYRFNNLEVVAEAAWYNANYPFTANWRMYFERAILEYNGRDVILYEPNKESFIFDLKEEVVVATGINLPPTGMFHSELSHFISCIREGINSVRISRQQIVEGVKILEEILKGE